jgi:hypothetical protein
MWLLAQNDAAPAVVGMLFMLVYLAIIIAFLAGMWKMFEKAGKPGWAAIIPIYNLVVLVEITGRPIWWAVLLLIPCVQLIFFLIVSIDLAKSFGKSELFGIGIWLLGFIFIPILGFGSDRYVGPTAAGR